MVCVTTWWELFSLAKKVTAEKLIHLPPINLHGLNFVIVPDFCLFTFQRPAFIFRPRVSSHYLTTQYWLAITSVPWSWPTVTSHMGVSTHVCMTDICAYQSSQSTEKTDRLPSHIWIQKAFQWPIHNTKLEVQPGPWHVRWTCCDFH